MLRLRNLAIGCAAAGVVSLGSGCFLFDRPNPRLKSMTRTQGDVEESVTLTYDKDGFLDKVVMKEVRATETLALSWQEGELDSVAITTKPTDEAFPDTEGLVRLTWDDEGRVVKVKETTEDPEPDDGVTPPVTTGAITYDDAGRFKTLSSSTASNNASVDDETRFVWSDAGELQELKASRAVVVDGDVTSEASTTYEIGAKDGRPSALTVKDDDFTMVLDAKLDDGDRIDAFEGERTRASAPDQSDRVVIGFSYDDEGRLSSVTASDDDGLTDDPITELVYDDGEAQGMDVTPYSVFFFGLWDLKGAGHLTLDPKTQGARFVLPTW